MDLSKETLHKLDLSRLSAIVSQLQSDIGKASRQLVHCLVDKDEKLRLLAEKEDRVTSLLINYASQNGLDMNLNFKISAPSSFSESVYKKWLQAWAVVSRIKRGIPKPFRKRVWDVITTHSIRSLNLNFAVLFREDRSAKDQEWLRLINKVSSHKLKSKYVTCKSVERILLAYSRHNLSAEFTSELFILSSLILKITEGNEFIAIKVLVCLMDIMLPPAYFTQELRTLHVELVVLNDLLSYFCPKLSSHLHHLQAVNSSSVCKSYSSSHPPTFKDSLAFEPPLTNIFVLRWFLNMFTNTLSWKALRRLFDAVILCGADMFLYAAVSIWGVFEKELLAVDNVSDYYDMVEELEDRLKNTKLLSSTEFIQMVYCAHEIARSNPEIPSINELRHKNTPLSPQPVAVQMSCPSPSQEEPIQLDNTKLTKTLELNIVTSPSQAVVAAKAECPQTIKKTYLYANAYAADIPNDVLALYSLNIPEPHFNMLKEGTLYTIDM